MELENVVYVYNKNMKLLAQFDGNTEGYNEEQMKNVMVAPTVHIETNGESSLSFQMLANCEKWQLIKDPENIYYLNGRYYTPLSEGSYVYSGEENIRVVNVTLVETWYLLNKQFNQAYNCGLYCYAKATFQRYTTDGAIFTIKASDCSNPGNTISSQNAWEQVKLWQPKDKDGNQLSYSVLKTKEFSPVGWTDAPSSVFFSSVIVSGDTATVIVQSRKETSTQQNFSYSGNSYSLPTYPYPSSIGSVTANITTATNVNGNIVYSSDNRELGYTYTDSNGEFILHYSPKNTGSVTETVNSISASYDYSAIGSLSTGATCTFAYGPEVVDEHTFLILPKSDTKYKLTIDGVAYNDSEVKDSRGVIMPRGSGGYAMWAALKNSGWKLGICDVIADGFDASIDYGCFNLESDMKDVLYNIQYIQELYGGILDWDSKDKILNYRAENSVDYQAYNDGFNKWTGYEFREGKNMAEQPEVTYDNDLITKAYPLGYGNLNIKKVNDNKSYIEDYSYTKNVYEGYIEQPLIFDTNDEGGQKQLLYWAKKELSKKCKPRKNIHIEAKDIRTVQGYEHEVFDINNVVRVYYKDDIDKTEVMEEKRIILWEYNAFALWDCTVELGDKTQNLSELFRLIYNKSVVDAPKVNASGLISSDGIYMDDMMLDEYEIDGMDLSEYLGYGGYGGYGNMLSEYISLIARKTTENSDAISGLIIQANETSAQSELFANYQKQTDQIVSDTYAGLKVYADEGMSQISATVEGNYKTLHNGINTLETTTKAGFEAQQTVNEATTRQFSQVDTRITNAEGKIVAQTKALAEFQTYASNNYASASMMATVQNELTGKATKAELQVTANNLESQITATANKVNTVANQVTTLADSISSVANNSYQKVAGITIGSGSVLIDVTSSVQIFAGKSITLYASQISIAGRGVSWDTITYATPGGGSATKNVLSSSSRW